MLTAVNQFNQVKYTLHLRNDESFTSFSRTLKQGAQAAWDAHVSDVEHTTENFDEYLHSFITTYTKKGSLKKFKNIFYVVCKERAITVLAMHTRLDFLNKLSLYLAKADDSKPGQNKIFTSDQVKQYWAQSMPSNWIKNGKQFIQEPQVASTTIHSTLV
jgi:hypothetical protein